MIKCELCKRQTEPKESTGKFVTYRKKIYEYGKDGRETISELKVCMNCNGEKIK